jgi:DNA-binding transcriptional regulator YdaS (Cro superfamily)
MPDAATRFREFLVRHNVTQLAAGVALGVSDPTVNAWVNGDKRPVAHHREAIAVWTHGEIPAEAWLEEAESEKVARVVPFAPPVEVEAGAELAVVVGT